MWKETLHTPVMAVPVMRWPVMWTSAGTQQFQPKIIELSGTHRWTQDLAFSSLQTLTSRSEIQMLVRSTMSRTAKAVVACRTGLLILLGVWFFSTVSGTAESNINGFLQHHRGLSETIRNVRMSDQSIEYWVFLQQFSISPEKSGLNLFPTHILISLVP